MNNITIEFCAEDRARIDRLIEALEALQPQNFRIEPPKPEQITIDEVQQALAEVVAKASTPTDVPKNAQEEAEAITPPVTQAEEATPTEAEDDVPWPTVTLEQIQQKVVQLAAGNNGAKKAKVREIVNAYAKKVSDLPEDKWAEVWNKLTALEAE